MYGNALQHNGRQFGSDQMAYTGKLPEAQPAMDRFDCETAVLMRAVMLPIFEQATSWSGLIDRLERKGYRLGFRQGRFCVLSTSDGVRICGLRFLGLSLRDLVERLGRPLVIAHTGNDAAGDILPAPPSPAIHH